MKIDDSIVEEILSQVKGSYKCLILFGSYSRGDENNTSDIDILQVTEDQIKPYSYGRLNYSVYNESLLVKMAKDGSLFAMHIIQEGSFIEGDSQFLNYLERIFVYPKNYHKYKSELLNVGNLLDVNEEDYLKDFEGFNLLICFLFRSYVYAYLYEEGKLVFSIEKVARRIRNKSFKNLLELRKEKDSNYPKFLLCRKSFESFSENTFSNDEGSIENLVKSLKYSGSLTVKLALKYLSKSVGNY